MRRIPRGFVVILKDLSVLCFFVLVEVTPSGSESLDFAHADEQVFSLNGGIEKGARHPSRFYVSNIFPRIDGPEGLLRNLKSLPLPNIPDPERGERRHFWRDHLFMYGAVWVFTFTVNFRGLGSKFSRDASFKKLGYHFVAPPELNDGDPVVTNYIAHPVFGAFTYHVFRQRGYTARQSFFASTLHSALFEYTVEGFIQRPSGVDLLVTPLVGAPVGARLGRWILPVSLSFIVMKYIFRSPL